MSATIGELEDERVVADGDDAASQGKLGVAVRPLTPEETQVGRRRRAASSSRTSRGAAAKAGVRPGDVIVAVNSTPVKSPEQLKELIGKAGKTVALLIQRDDAQIFVPVTIG